MTNAEYVELSGVRRSDLWRMQDSPQKFWWALNHPEPPTPALVFGQLVHKLLLEPEGFDAEFAVQPDGDRRTKAAREAYDAFVGDAQGKAIVTRSDVEKAAEMATAARQAPFVERLLAGERETPIQWTDEATGEQCKARLDCLSCVGGKLVVVDYKTTMDASTEAFARAAVRYGYDFQAAFYAAGVEATTGERPLVVFIAQEKTAPYAVNVMQMDELFVQRGRGLYRMLLDEYHKCRVSGDWWGYQGPQETQAINTLFAPAWA